MDAINFIIKSMKETNKGLKETKDKLLKINTKLKKEFNSQKEA